MFPSRSFHSSSSIAMSDSPDDLPAFMARDGHLEDLAALADQSSGEDGWRTCAD